jgi:hypothetical protein
MTDCGKNIVNVVQQMIAVTHLVVSTSVFMESEIWLTMGLFDQKALNAEPGIQYGLVSESQELFRIPSIRTSGYSPPTIQEHNKFSTLSITCSKLIIPDQAGNGGCKEDRKL